MALEDLTGPDKFITNLVETNPLAADDRREGDDHIRGIKNVLNNTFPRLDAVVDLTPAELSAAKGAVQKAGDTMTGPLKMADGTAAAPSIAFADEADMGIYSPAAGELGIAAGGVKKYVFAGGQSAVLDLFRGAGAFTNAIRGWIDGKQRWQLDLGNTSAGDFTVSRWSVVGALVDVPFIINTAGGEAWFKNAVQVGGISQSADPGYTGGPGFKFRSNGTGNIGCTGSGTNGLFITKDNVAGAFALFGFGSMNPGPPSVIGSIDTQTGTSVRFNTTSDYRLKTEVVDMPPALASLLSTRPVAYKWITGFDGEGFIAHEVAGLIPGLVSGEKDGRNEDGSPKYQQIDLMAFIPRLVKAIQELHAANEELRGRIIQLEKAV